MVGRILRTADFERVLGVSPRSRSAHFAAHHVLAVPSVAPYRVKQASKLELSTADAPSCQLPVDDLAVEVAAGCWLGTVVPKRHARRSVTRSLMKRQMRAVMAARAAHLPPGLWVLRLKSGFDVRQFPSASSEALRDSVRDELHVLLQRAVQPQR